MTSLARHSSMISQTSFCSYAQRPRPTPHVIKCQERSKHIEKWPRLHASSRLREKFCAFAGVIPCDSCALALIPFLRLPCYALTTVFVDSLLFLRDCRERESGAREGPTARIDVCGVDSAWSVATGAVSCAGAIVAGGRPQRWRGVVADHAEDFDSAAVGAALLFPRQSKCRPRKGLRRCCCRRTNTDRLTD
jgi:hypothetical protein